MHGLYMFRLYVPNLYVHSLYIPIIYILILYIPRPIYKLHYLNTLPLHINYTYYVNTLVYICNLNEYSKYPTCTIPFVPYIYPIPNLPMAFLYPKYLNILFYPTLHL
jgi:hypothetical protein